MEALEIPFILITASAILFMGFATRQITKICLIFLFWAGISGVLAYKGFYLNTDGFPPRILSILVPSVVLVIYLYRTFVKLSLDLAWLIGIHLLRVPVELVLHRLYMEGMIPELMTYSGWNFDILSGISAVVVLLLHITGRLSRRVLLIWNWTALILLVIIVTMAILSTPTVLQVFARDQPNMAVMHFPFVWLPAIVVPLVFLSHLLIFKSSRKNKNSAKTN